MGDAKLSTGVCCPPALLLAEGMLIETTLAGRCPVRNTGSEIVGSSLGACALAQRETSDLTFPREPVKIMGIR